MPELENYSSFVQAYGLRTKKKATFKDVSVGGDLDAPIKSRTAVTLALSAPADYVCDGTNDAATIKAAFTDAQAKGVPLNVGPGTFPWPAQLIFKLKGNITVNGTNTVFRREHDDNRSMLDIGSTSGPAFGNITFTGITFDLNNKGTGWGLVISWCHNVRIERCKFINPTNNMKAALFLGKYAGGSDNFEAHTITVRDCTFEYGNLGWEYVGVIGARNVTFDNCKWVATTATNQSKPGVLAYNTEQFRLLNSFVDHARITVGGRGSYTITGTQFETSLMFIEQARDVIVLGNSFYAWGSTTGMEIGVQCKGGYKTMADDETPWYISEDTVFNNEGIIIQGNTFRGCKASAIRTKTTTEHELEVLDCTDISILNNKINGCTGIPIVAFGDRVRISGNEILNGNTANANASSYHMYVAGEETIITDNYASSPNVATDIVVDQARNATLVPTMNLRARDNIFKSATRIKYFAASDGVSAAPSLTEAPENVTVIGTL